MSVKTGPLKGPWRRTYATTVPRPARTAALALAAVLVVSHPPGVAGQSAQLPSVRIRIHRNDSDTTVEGLLVSMDEEGLVYRPVEGRDVRINRESVDSVQLGVRHSHPWRGVAIGVVGGGLIGTIVGNATYKPCDACLVNVGGRNLNVVGGAIAGGLLGAIVGAIVGSAIKTESWKPVVVPWSGEPKGLALGVQIPVGHHPRRQSQ